jgi:hypothetical protein
MPYRLIGKVNIGNLEKIDNFMAYFEKSWQDADRQHRNGILSGVRRTFFSSEKDRGV